MPPPLFVVQEGTKFWYGADKKYLSHGGKGAKWFELTGAELKNYDSMTFTIIPASGPVRDSRIRSVLRSPLVSHGAARSQNTGSQMIFQALPMQSKRVPDMIDAVKEILGIVDPDSDDDEDT